MDFTLGIILIAASIVFSVLVMLLRSSKYDEILRAQEEQLSLLRREGAILDSLLIATRNHDAEEAEKLCDELQEVRKKLYAAEERRRKLEGGLNA